MAIVWTNGVMAGKLTPPWPPGPGIHACRRRRRRPAASMCPCPGGCGNGSIRGDNRGGGATVPDPRFRSGSPKTTQEDLFFSSVAYSLALFPLDPSIQGIVRTHDIVSPATSSRGCRGGGAPGRKGSPRMFKHRGQTFVHDETNVELLCTSSRGEGGGAPDRVPVCGRHEHQRRAAGRRDPVSQMSPVAPQTPHTEPVFCRFV